ncbi:MAG: glutaredoxin family protein [Gammaproteobacteria bacterium]|nr:glutaredoxin family protein [Pseudomonadales bacterium]MCP5346078.1 glutaredoxin family protein [Pseudomonadales bacterium]
MQPLILYSTAGCHLCEEAELLLRQLALELPLQWQTIDIASDQVLVERYGIRIPVLCRADSGGELGWPFDGDRIREFIVADG